MYVSCVIVCEDQTESASTLLKYTNVFNVLLYIHILHIKHIFVLNKYTTTTNTDMPLSENKWQIIYTIWYVLR